MLRAYRWLELQAKIIKSIAQKLVIDGGRRFGKSFTSAPAVLKRMHRRHEIMMECLRTGKPAPWAPQKQVLPWGGIGRPAKHARHIDANINVAVVAPMDRHLTRCKNYMRSYYAGPYQRFGHPDLFFADAGRQTWIVYGGIATKITYCVGKSIQSVVSDENDILWIDEAGLLENMIWEAVYPTTLEGLPLDHPWYEPDVVEPDPNTEVFICSSYEAFDENVRKNSRKAAKLMGEAYEKKWILGDWRLPNIYVFDNWDAQKHVVDYDPATRKLAGREQPLPPPKLIVGVIDFAYSPTNPGAACVYHVWFRNPLDDPKLTSKDFHRPLIIAVEDLQQAKEYTGAGWFQDLSAMRYRTGLRYWFCDPARDEMYQQCLQYKNKRPAIGLVRKASNVDKAGRLVLLRGLLEAQEDGYPAFMVRNTCTELPRQFAGLKWKLNAKKEPTDTPSDFDDHCIDCTAFLMNHVNRGQIGLPGAAVA
jgi:hypothetical protein